MDILWVDRRVVKWVYVQDLNLAEMKAVRKVDRMVLLTVVMLDTQWVALMAASMVH